MLLVVPYTIGVLMVVFGGIVYAEGHETVGMLSAALGALVIAAVDAVT
jgi:hypothetical protein